MISPILCFTGYNQKRLLDLDHLTDFFVHFAVNVYFGIFFFLLLAKLYRCRHIQIPKLPGCLLHLFRNMLVSLYSGEHFTVQ